LAEGKIFSVADSPSASVVIVPGASVLSSGKPSDILADRLSTAIDLYEAGKVKKFLLSGDHGQVNYNEVETMGQYLLDQGISADDIVLDHAGFDTYDTMVRAREIFQVDSAVVVTQEFHLPRAIYLGRAAGLDITGVVADKKTYVKMSYFIFREYFARVKAVLDVWTQAAPKYLGEPLPINVD
jgi:SanA protein